MEKRKIVVVTILIAAIVVLMTKNSSSENIGSTPDAIKIKKKLSESVSKEFRNIDLKEGNIHEITITASNNKISAFGEKEIDLFTYNNQIPGPEIRIKKGDTVKATLINDLEQPTTIHWHGIRVPHAMDGVPGLSQAPVQPGEEFTYTFTPPDAGTFWYHPHVRTSEQLEKGLYGILIVEEVDEPEFTRDLTWVIDDWKLDENGDLYPKFNTPHDLSHDGRWGGLITVNGVQDQLVDVRPGERLRLRLINVSNARVYKPYFYKLKPNVIAVDGMTVSESFDANGFILSPGNRIDLDLTIPEGLVGESLAVMDQFTRYNNNLGKFIVGTDIVETPIFANTFDTDFPDWSASNSLEPDHTFILNARRGGELGIEWTIDGNAFPEYQTLDLKEGDFYKLSFKNVSSRLHPMHLHGQFFKLLSRNGVPASEPFWRDTVLVSSKETVDIGIVPYGKGEWANHCHILEHAEAGMITTINVI